MKKNRKFLATLLTAVITVSLLAAMPLMASARGGIDADDYDFNYSIIDKYVSYLPASTTYTVNSSRELISAISDLHNIDSYKEVNIRLGSNLIHDTPIVINKSKTLNIYLLENTMVVNAPGTGITVTDNARLNIIGPGRLYIVSPTGITTSNNGWMHLTNNPDVTARATTWVDIGNDSYYFENGNIVTGWKQIEGRTDSDKKFWYFFRAGGQVMANTVETINGKTYQFQYGGEMIAQDWGRWGGDWFYYDSEGVRIIEDWLTLKDKKYYLGKNGVMQTGWQEIDKRWYYFNPTGDMVSEDWVYWGDAWYYFNRNGQMAEREWIRWRGNSYYLKTNGKLAENEWVWFSNSWYWVDGNGRMATGWVLAGDKWYYMKANGEMLAGEWLNLNGVWYYLKNTGAMAENENLTISGKIYNFDITGACTNRS